MHRSWLIGPLCTKPYSFSWNYCWVHILLIFVCYSYANIQASFVLKDWMMKMHKRTVLLIWLCMGVLMTLWGLLWVFSRRRVVQVFARGARILDGSYMTQDLSFGVSNSESSSSSESSTVSSVSIADPYVLLRMSDGTIQLLVGGMIWFDGFCYLFFLYVTNIYTFYCLW